MDTKTQIFIERAEKVHGEKYDYTRTVYVQARSKLTISCKKHGDFDQIADSIYEEAFLSLELSITSDKQ